MNYTRHNLIVPLVVGLSMGANAAPTPKSSNPPKKVTPPVAVSIAPTMGVVDDEKLKAVRIDYPELASKVLPQIAAIKKLKIVIHKTGIMFGSPVLALDITDEVIARLNVVARDIPAPLNDVMLTAPQRKAAEEAIKALRKMQNAVELDLSTEDAKKLLVEVKAEVESDVHSLPQSKLSLQIESSLAVYVSEYNLLDTVMQTAEINERTIANKRAAESAGVDNPVLLTILRQKWEQEDKEINDKAMEPVVEKFIEAEGCLAKAIELMQ